MSNGGHVAAIIEGFEEETAVQSLSDTITQSNETSETKSQTLKLAKNKTILLKSEPLVMVRNTKGGTFTINSIFYKSDENRPQAERKILQTLPNKVFCIVAVNTSESPVTLPENMRIGQQTEAPSKIVPLKNALSVKLVKAMLFYEESQNKEKTFTSHEQETTNDKGKQKIN